MATNSAARTADRQSWAVGGGLLALAALLFLRSRSFWFLVDDAFIAFRYAENFAAGRGLVFNLGERVEGYTDFLWVTLLAGARVVGLGVPEAAQWLGAASGLATLPLTWWAARRVFEFDPISALLPCAVVAANAPFAIWMGAGLETSLFAALITFALARTSLDLGGTSGRIPLGGFAFGLAALTRPEALGLLVVLSGASLFSSPRHPRAFAWVVGGGASVIGPHLLFRWVYYGNLLPNTFYAKVSSELPLADGARYLGEFLLTSGTAWGLTAAAGLLLTLKGAPRRQALLSAFPVAAALGYLVLVGGDFYPFSRFCTPYLPWLVLLCCAGARELGAKVGAQARLPAITFAATSMLVAGAAWPLLRHPTAVAAHQRSVRLFEIYGRRLAETVPPTALVAASSLGAIGYYSGLPMLDLLGLVDPHLARSTKAGKGRAAHRKFDSDYVLRRSPDMVTIEFAREAEQLASDDVTTELVNETVLRAPNWPAVTDLLARPDFRHQYVPEAVELEPGLFIFQFRRDARLAALKQRLAAEGPELELLLELAGQYRKQGLYVEALEAAEQAAELAPTLAEPQIRIGYYLLESRRFELAKVQFDQLLAALPSHPRVLFGSAMTAHRMGRHEEAISGWNAVLSAAPLGKEADTARALLREAALDR